MELKRYMVVFDLDDTLYKERDYVISGLSFVGSMIAKVFSETDHSASLIKNFLNGQKDPIGTLWDQLALPVVAKKAIISAMRAHQPDITLDERTSALIGELRSSGAGFSILTDGRSITQRSKIAALGLNDARTTCISEEIGSEKPSTIGFKVIEKRSPNRTHVYIGDNPQKDFIAPNMLGWQTFRVKDDGRNIERPAFQIDQGAAAYSSIDHPAEVLDYLE